MKFTWNDFDEILDVLDVVLAKNPEFYGIDQLKYKTTSDDKSYVLKVDVPGFGPEDVGVEFEGRHLVVTFGEKTKKFRVPQNADQDGTTAEVKNGLLTVTLPKKEQKTSSVKIQVK